MSKSGLNMSRRIRRTPYTDKVEKHGVRGFTVVNHMLLPKAFQPSVEEDYWHLRKHVQIWDVSCQRQVEIIGPDAAKLVQWMTPRDISKAMVGDCLYVPLIDENAGMINDPVLLKIAEDHFWLSIADSDILLWAKGLAIGRDLDVQIDEPDVSPLAIQGPKAKPLMETLFGPDIQALGFFKFGYFDLLGTSQLIACSGYSKQGGYEIYLKGGDLGPALWDLIWNAGQAFNISPGCPNLIERVEGGLMSFGNDFTRANNPLECGLKKFCHLGNEFDYIGRRRLLGIAETGVKQSIRGITFGNEPTPNCSQPFPIFVPNGDQIGQITTGIYSPRLKHNIGMSMINKSHWKIGTKVIVCTPDGNQRDGEVSPLPFKI